MIFGLILALASAVATNLAFLFKHRGAVLAAPTSSSDVLSPACSAMPLALVGIAGRSGSAPSVAQRNRWSEGERFRFRTSGDTPSICRLLSPGIVSPDLALLETAINDPSALALGRWLRAAS